MTAAGGIVAVHTADAVVEMEKELARFATGDVTDEELSRAKTAMIRGLPARLETQGAVVDSLAELVLDGLPLDYFAKLPTQVATVQKADVARAAKRVVVPDQWQVVVVGPKKLSEDALGKLGLGKVTVVTPE